MINSDLAKSVLREIPLAFPSYVEHSWIYRTRALKPSTPYLENLKIQTAQPSDCQTEQAEAQPDFIQRFQISSQYLHICIQSLSNSCTLASANNRSSRRELALSTKEDQKLKLSDSKSQHFKQMAASRVLKYMPGTLVPKRWISTGLKGQQGKERAFLNGYRLWNVVSVV
jgi:hypothetical protein